MKRFVVSLFLFTLSITTAANAQSICTPAEPPENWRWSLTAEGRPGTEERDRAAIRIRTLTDVTRVRRDLIRFLFGTSDLPANRVASRTPGGEELLLATPRNFDHAEHLVVDMGLLRSHVYVFWPKNPKPELIIYHSGHEMFLPKPMLLSTYVIEYFLERGYAVASVSMPLNGANSGDRPIIRVPGAGEVEMLTHDQLIWIAPETGHRLRYFVEPVVVAINELIRDGFQSVTMVGVSGGGWTTTMAAAVDPRITRSYSVAGSIPLHWRWYDGGLGDYENAVPELLDIASDMELYVLDSGDYGRHHEQVLLKYDNCCYAFPDTPAYVQVVKDAVSKLGVGDYQFHLDDTVTVHSVPLCTLDRIIDDLNTPALPPIEPVSGNN